MRKYVIHQASHKVMTSGKVREDIVLLSSQLGYEKLEEDELLSFPFEQNDIVLFPYPSRKGYELEDKAFIDHVKSRQAKLILLTLNVDYLRYDMEESLKALSIETMNEADVIITLSIRMRMQLNEDGVHAPSVILNFHDYLTKSNRRDAVYEKTLIFAGSPYKAEYLTNWPNQTPIDVYSRPEEAENLLDIPNVSYVGYTNPNQIAKVLNYGFGLAFDESNDNGKFSDYQTMNLSHKVSMFLAAGIPLVINRRAASASTIEAANAGILISSVNEIDEALSKITEEDYHEMAFNANLLGELIRRGFYYRKAILQAEHLI